MFCFKTKDGNYVEFVFMHWKSKFILGKKKTSVVQTAGQKHECLLFVDSENGREFFYRDKIKSQIRFEKETNYVYKNTNPKMYLVLDLAQEMVKFVHEHNFTTNMLLLLYENIETNDNNYPLLK